MEGVLRQFYHEARGGSRIQAPLLTPRELAVKATITKCIQVLADASDEELARLVLVLRSEGMEVSEPSIRLKKFVAAATVIAFEPLSQMFRKM